MAGPTPVSALIHAATMVTAGVYLMTRSAALLDGRLLVGPRRRRVGGRAHRPVRRHHRHRPERHQEGAGVLDDQPARLHVPRRRCRGLRRRRLPHGHARLLQGVAVPRVGIGDPRPARATGHAASWARCARRCPITAATFIVGWLAIAGVPPFAGFWSKDEILLFAFERSPLLWAVGLFTALLTAFYMSRQVFMVFFGDARWDEAATCMSPTTQRAPRSRRPTTPSPSRPRTASTATHASNPTSHRGRCCCRSSCWPSSPPSAGVLNLPFTHDTKILENWLHPVVEEFEAHIAAATATKVVLAVVATLGRARRHRRRLARVHPPAHPRRPHRARRARPRLVLRRVHHASSWADRASKASKPRPASTATVVDGAVNGTGALVQAGGRRLRPLQSGYVRNYAVGVALGAVVLVAVFLGQAR